VWLISGYMYVCTTFDCHCHTATNSANQHLCSLAHKVVMAAQLTWLTTTSRLAGSRGQRQWSYLCTGWSKT